MYREYFFFLIILSLLYLLLFRKEYFVINQDKWLEYRLGDIIRGDVYKKKNERPYFISVPKKFPNSIASIYIQRTNNLQKQQKFNNFKILNDIILEKSNNCEKPDKNDIVIHLRVGDSIIGEDKNDFKYNTRNWGTYAIKLETIKKMIPKIKETNINSVVIVYGAHKKSNKELNEKYINKVKDLLRMNNFYVREKNTGDPDKDFLFMANSKYFVKSGGNFSNIISKIVELNQGVVFDSTKFN